MLLRSIGNVGLNTRGSVMMIEGEILRQILIRIRNSESGEKSRGV